MSTTGITIRPLAAEDFAVWAPLWQAYLTFYEASLPEATSRTTFARLTDPAEPMWGALAFEGDTPLGLVHALSHRSTWSVTDYCYLNDLFVSPAARGKGVGRALIEHVYAEAALRGCADVYWLTHETNTTAQRLYNTLADRPGFIEYRKRLG